MRKKSRKSFSSPPALPVLPLLAPALKGGASKSHLQLINSPAWGKFLSVGSRREAGLCFSDWDPINPLETAEGLMAPAPHPCDTGGKRVCAFLCV